MPEELIMQVRWPIPELVEQIRRKHGLKEPLTDFRLEGDALVLYFSRATESSLDLNSTTPQSDDSRPEVPAARPRTRRKTKRNRMKTRGWGVVAKITNSKGMTATIYKPFVDALQGGGMSRAEQKAVVARILRSNGNRPEEKSIEYYLDNTLEYLQKVSSGGE